VRGGRRPERVKSDEGLGLTVVIVVAVGLIIEGVRRVVRS
jgi:hypothetical protein